VAGTVSPMLPLACFVTYVPAHAGLRAARLDCSVMDASVSTGTPRNLCTQGAHASFSSTGWAMQIWVSSLRTRWRASTVPELSDGRHDPRAARCGGLGAPCQ